MRVIAKFGAALVLLAVTLLISGFLLCAILVATAPADAKESNKGPRAYAGATLLPGRLMPQEPNVAPCMLPPEKSKTMVWLITDENGRVLIVGTAKVRRRC